MARKFKPLHGLTKLPKGVKVGDLIPVFNGVEDEVYIGKPNPVCASCRKPFTNLRKRRKAVRLYPVRAEIPVAFSFDICGACLSLYRRGGQNMDAVLASVEAYCDGEEATA